MGRARLLFGDCLDVLRDLPTASVDAVVTDPPSAISMMEEEWDGDRGGRQEWIAWLSARLAESRRVSRPGAHALVWALPRRSHWTGIAIEDAGWTILDSIDHLMGNGYPKSKGHGLKPAHEVWWLASNGPGTILNLNACQVRPSGRRAGNVVISHHVDCVEDGCSDDCPVVELDRQSGETVSRVRRPRSLKAGNGWRMTKTGKEYDDRGGASRFFPRFMYCARAKRSERDSGLGFRANDHPTVKPVDLMRWLIRLVTPSDGCVLDPFVGSGTTAMAAKMEGFHFVGIEEKMAYVRLSHGRLRSIE